MTDYIKKIRKKYKRSNAGFTLVELMATFALLAIFMVAATNIIFKTMSIYYQARGTSYGMQVTEIIASKITGLVEGAQNTGRLENTDDYTNVSMMSDDASVLIVKADGTNENDSLELVDATGSRISIRTVKKNDKNYLSIHYYPVTEGEKRYSSADNRYYYDGQLYKAVDWEFDTKTYMDYSIKSLVFEKPDDLQGNVIRMKLTVVSDKYGEYSCTKYIECYNFEEADYGKIK